MEKTKYALKVLIVTIAVFGIIGGITALCIWGTIPVIERDVEYKDMEKRIGEYIAIPDLPDSAVIDKCSVRFPG